MAVQKSKVMAASNPFLSFISNISCMLAAVFLPAAI
jgi:hypothetical protein